VRRASLVGLAGAVVAASAAGSAHAAPPWSEPRSIGAPTGVVSDAEIGFWPGGTALLSRRTSAVAGAQEDTVERLATLTPDGRLVEHRPLSDRLAAPPQLFGRGRVALLRARLLSKQDATQRRVRLSLSVGSLRRALGRGRAQRLASFTTFPGGGSPAMAAGPRGRIAIAWIAYRGDDLGLGRFRVRLALRRPNGRVDMRTVAAGSSEESGGNEPPGVAVAIGARGDVIVAYTAAGPIRVRTLRRGRRFGRAQTLGPQSGVFDLGLRASRTGRTVVAWGTQDGGEEANEPYVVRAAVRAPGAARFGPTLVIDAGEANGSRVPGRMRLAMTADGTAALAWSNAKGRFAALTTPVRVAVAERNGGFGPVAELAANGAAQDVALRADGTAIVTWTDARGFTFPPPSPQTFAALRAGPGQPFGPPELVASSSPDGGLGRQAAAAYDPRTGRPTLIWTASGGSDVLQLATRSG